MTARLHLYTALAGWALFVVSAVFFILSSLRNGDALGLAGALFFFVACFVFIVPLALEVRAPARGSGDAGLGTRDHGRSS